MHFPVLTIWTYVIAARPAARHENDCNGMMYVRQRINNQHTGYCTGEGRAAVAPGASRLPPPHPGAHESWPRGLPRPSRTPQTAPVQFTALSSLLNCFCRSVAPDGKDSAAIQRRGSDGAQLRGSTVEAGLRAARRGGSTAAELSRNTLTRHGARIEVGHRVLQVEDGHHVLRVADVRSGPARMMDADAA